MLSNLKGKKRYLVVSACPVVGTSDTRPAHLVLSVTFCAWQKNRCFLEAPSYVELSVDKSQNSSTFKNGWQPLAVLASMFSIAFWEQRLCLYKTFLWSGLFKCLMSEIKYVLGFSFPKIFFSSLYLIFFFVSGSKKFIIDIFVHSSGISLGNFEVNILTFCF